MHILLIEDEPKTAATVRSFLEEHHMTVDCAYDGHTGSQLATQNQYVVIVSDVILPHANGLDLCRELRNRGVATPILLLSAHSQTEDKITGLNA